MEHFISMGGYGGFVWPSYAVGALVMIGLLAVSLRSARRAEAELELLKQSRARRSGKTAGEAA